MSDATGVSSEFVANKYKSAQAAEGELTPDLFFRRHASFDRELYCVAVVVADIKLRSQTASPVCLDTYLSDLPELASHAELWKVFDAADPIMSEHEGPAWRKRWNEMYSTGNASRTSEFVAEPVPKSGRMPTIDLERLKEGDKLLDFSIHKLIGRGTYGTVYLASNLKLGREVALKVTSATGNEGRALARLNHDNIVRVYGEHSIGSKQILEMQYVRGGTLAGWIAERGDSESVDFLNWAKAKGGNDDSSADLASPSLNPHQSKSAAELAVSIVRQLASALQHAHDRGILHQDVKPANILVDDCGNPLLTDFNVAFIAGQKYRNAIGGTVNYMSPEQLRAYCAGDAKSIQMVDVKSDIYSLGLLLFELLGGEKDSSDVTSSNSEVRARQLLASRMRAVPEVRKSVTGVNHSLRAIVSKALQSDPGRRYQSAAELETDLSRWLDGRGNVHASNPNPVENAIRFLSREKLRVAAAILCVAVTVCGVFGLIVWESAQLKNCEQVLSDSEEAIEGGKGAIAAQQLGKAKAQLEQLRLLPWYEPDRFEAVQRKVEQCASRMESLESFRFSALFGQASLLSMHEDDSEPGIANELIGNSLDLYRVLSDPNWQTAAPFSRLRPSRQDEVSEHISELMLVSMVNSSRKDDPSVESWEKVRRRLPRQHKEMKVFECLSSGSSVPDSAYGGVEDGFDCYLFGVWATCCGENQVAYDWYSKAISKNIDHGGERFWLRYRQALTCQRLGNSDSALLHYSICWGMRPGFAWIPFNMALVHVNQDDRESAIECLRRSIALDPKLAAAYAALHAVYQKAGDDAAAAEVRENAAAAGVEFSEL